MFLAERTVPVGEWKAFTSPRQEPLYKLLVSAIADEFHLRETYPSGSPSLCHPRKDEGGQQGTWTCPPGPVLLPRLLGAGASRWGWGCGAPRPPRRCARGPRFRGRERGGRARSPSGSYLPLGTHAPQRAARHAAEVRATLRVREKYRHRPRPCRLGRQGAPSTPRAFWGYRHMWGTPGERR